MSDVADHPVNAVHWTVQLNGRTRALFFPLLWLGVGLHLWALQAGVLAWVALGLQCFVYPQLTYF